MAEKAKAKKAKTVSKKASVKSKKRDDLEQPEDLALQVEEMPRRSGKGKLSFPAEKPATQAAEISTRVNEAIDQNVPTVVEIIAPVQPRVVVNKPDAPRQESIRNEHRQEAKKAEVENDGLRLRLSQSLTKKLKEQAADEGISLEEFVGELLAESVVLRAWEIVERKNAMKGQSQQGPNSNSHRPNSNNSNQGGGNRGGQRGNNQSNKGHRGMSHVRYQTIMDDKATFLEYVRSQEKPRR